MWTLPAGLTDALNQDMSSMEGLTAQLDDYLELRRSAFPRLHFLSDADLLGLLSRCADEPTAAVQLHITKLFGGIGRLELAGEPGKGEEVRAMVSPQGERVPFAKCPKVGPCSDCVLCKRASGELDCMPSCSVEAFASTCTSTACMCRGSCTCIDCIPPGERIMGGWPVGGTHSNLICGACGRRCKENQKCGWARWRRPCSSPCARLCAQP